jgi:hypothetical protein
MIHTLENRTQVRESLKGRKIKNVEFGDSKGEIRSLALHLDDGSSVVLTATAWQALEVEQS